LIDLLKQCGDAHRDEADHTLTLKPWDEKRFIIPFDKEAQKTRSR
jgi:hypothetical protein